MKLSIITINYNNLSGLQKTIDSVISQSFKEFEWIIIDGGSSDGSKALIEQHSNHFSYWVSEPDNGIYNAMNKGIDHAGGDWLLFLNSGDWLFSNDILERVFSRDYDADILYGDVMYHWPDERGLELDQKPDKLSLYFFNERTICHQATFYRKKIFENHRYSEEYKICSDWALFIQLALENYHFEHLPFCIVNFVQDGISSKLTKEHQAERRKVFESLFPDIIKPDIEELKRQEDHLKKINSHKIYRIIMKNAEKKIALAERLVKLIEKIRTK